ncbi:HAD-IA family hydrolase [Catellatospora coxensis]
MVFTYGDDVADWLRAGEALSAVLLAATAARLGSAPISDVIEVRATREQLGRLLRGGGHPQAVVRVGHPPAGDRPPVRAARHQRSSTHERPGRWAVHRTRRRGRVRPGRGADRHRQPACGSLAGGLRQHASGRGSTGRARVHAVRCRRGVPGTCRRPSSDRRGARVHRGQGPEPAGGHARGPAGDGDRLGGRQPQEPVAAAKAGRAGVRTFPSSVALARRLRAAGVFTAVVTASRNATQVLAASQLGDLFDVRVDGTDAAALGLPGKPDPATYLEAVRRLHVSPDRAVIIEDAEPGVEAGRRGGFGLVVGVDRDSSGALAAAGAHIVVADLADLPVDLVGLHTLPGDTGAPQGLLGGGRPSTGWTLRYNGYDRGREGLREALCTLGNGYVATRGAAAECQADGAHYPGTYMSGLYNRLTTPIDGRLIEHEHLVNAPNWLPLRFRIAGGDWFSPDTAHLIDHQLELDLRAGVLTRVLRWCDPSGRLTRVQQRRLVHLATPHIAALETTFVAENWSGGLQVCTGIDGGVVNANLPEDAPLTRVHLQTEQTCIIEPDTILLTAVTTQSRIRIAAAARTRVRDSAGHDVPVSRARTAAKRLSSGRTWTWTWPRAARSSSRRSPRSPPRATPRSASPGRRCAPRSAAPVTSSTCWSPTNGPGSGCGTCSI